MSGNTIKKRMEELAAALSADLHERREHAAVILLAALAGQNTFLLGPPGTAKSLLARRLASVFADSNGRYFEYLMQKFSTPEDIFGPVSIAALKGDEYKRNSNGFLPTAEFAFLDEIWKSGPAILNTLLTIINEKKFRNGAKMENVPLKTLIAASNETPPEGQGLEALYDRFIVRLYAPPIAGEDEFDKFLHSASVTDKADCGDIVVKPDEWEKWRKGMRKIELSAETMQIIRAIRRQLAEKHDELEAYVSDRRWKKAAEMLRAAAFFCGRQKTNLADTLLLRHCLWTTNKNREAVVAVVDNAVRASGFATELSSMDIAAEKEHLEKEIQKELFYTKDVYETVKLADEQPYFKTQVNHSQYSNMQECYILAKQMKSGAEFHPVDESGNEIKYFVCTFRGQGSYAIKPEGYGRVSTPNHNGWIDEIVIKPKVLFGKGDRKSGVNARLIGSLKGAVHIIQGKLDDILEDIAKQKDAFAAEMDTPFVGEEVRKIAIEGVEEQLQTVHQQSTDCDRLLKLIGSSE